MSDEVPLNPFEESVPLGGCSDPGCVGESSGTSVASSGESVFSGFSGMDWLGNDTVGQPVTSRVSESGRRAGSGPRPRRYPDRGVLTTVVIGVAMVMVVVVSAIVVAVLWGRPGVKPHRTGRDSLALGVPPTPAVPAATVDCVDGDRDGVITGTAVGGLDSSPDAIFWFQHSYYVERSGSRAREVVASDAAVTSAEEIQRGIDSIPSGTRYCVHITPVSDTRFRVEVNEQRPDTEPPQTYVEVVTTAARADGHTLITGIAAG